MTRDSSQRSRGTGPTPADTPAGEPGTPAIDLVATIELAGQRTFYAIQLEFGHGDAITALGAYSPASTEYVRRSWSAGRWLEVHWREGVELSWAELDPITRALSYGDGRAA